MTDRPKPRFHALQRHQLFGPLPASALPYEDDADIQVCSNCGAYFEHQAHHAISTRCGPCQHR